MLIEQLIWRIMQIPRLLSTSAFASVDNSLLNLHNSSHHTQPHSMIANYTVKPREVFGITNDVLQLSNSKTYGREH